MVLGGNTLVPGFDERLKRELRLMTASDIEIKFADSSKDR